MDYSPFYFKNFYQKKSKKSRGQSYAPAFNQEKDKDSAYSRGEEDMTKQNMTNEHNKNRMQNTTTKNKVNEPLYEKTAAANRKRQGDKTGLFTAVIILLCFLCVVVLSDFFSGGVIVSGLKIAFNPNQGIKYYFLCTGEYHTEFKAVTYAEDVRKKGGAGYIHIDNERYYVVIATFLEKKAAKSVQNKNEGTTIFEMQTKQIELTSVGTKDRELADKVQSVVTDGIRKLYLYANALDAKESEHLAVMDKLSNMRNEFLYLKEEVAVSTINTTDKNTLFRIIDPMYGGLDALFYEASGSFLSAAIRNITAGAVTALCY